MPSLLTASEGPRWADLVFHVLAHVEATETLAASLWDRTYVAFAERHLGPAEHRALGEDARVLGSLIRSHDELASVQILAWLFAGVDRARAAQHRDLRDLAPTDVDDAGALEAIQGLHAAVEVLRAAAELEAQAYERLPELPLDRNGLARALGEVVDAAPFLRRCEVGVLRALRLRGRARGETIWVGWPCAELRLTVEHAAWQASHEGTVLEIGEHSVRSGASLGEREREHAAVVLLAERASAAGLGDPHRRWLGHFGQNAPDVRPASLGAEAERIVRAAIQGR